MYEFKPRFKLSSARVARLAEQYMESCMPRERKQEYLLVRKCYENKGKLKRLDVDQLATVAGWNAPRTRAAILKNDHEFAREVTRVALDPKSSCRLRVEVLQLLTGVGWPTASAILHFFHANEYPILDFHALDSLSIAAPRMVKPRGFTAIKQYDFDFWREYTHYTRGLCEKYKVDMRILDRALWQFSKSREKK